jgi:microcystin-dependent protein
MPGFPAPFIRFHEVDANGKPLAGGKLWSYVAGTSTPLATYTTADLTTPNTNPTILDASGRASVFIEDGVGYKFVLMDALDNVMWTADKIQVPDVSPAPVTPIMPAGSIVAFGGATIPAGWLLCNGTPVSTTDYPALFQAIGINYGGAGSTFHLPNLQQRFPLGKAVSGTGAALGLTGGAIDHTHTVPRAGWTPAGVSAAQFIGYLQTTAGSQGNIDVPTGDATSGPSNPPYLTVNYIIKT